MYYRTKKDSKTGLKLQAIVDKKNKAHKECVALSEKYGFKSWRSGYWVAFGGISSVIFEHKPDSKPDSKIWGKGAAKGEYMPKLNSKAGKAINEEMEFLTVVSPVDLNQCVGCKENINRIGFTFSDSEYFGFQTGKDYSIEVPDDCEEILESVYKNMSNNKTK